jgi:hypothetical protein
MSKRSKTSRVERSITALALACLGGCSDDGGDGSVVYKTEVKPLLERRCAICHDMQHPFDVATDGLFVIENPWSKGHDSLPYNVVPGDPDQSFLIQKVTDPEILPGASNQVFEQGQFMPPQPPALTAGQIANIETWIAEGAGDTELFRTSVNYIFGNAPPVPEGVRADDPCEKGEFNPLPCTPCTSCHFTGSTNPPDLSDPLALVGKSAAYRVDLQLIVPGDPESSFLLMKLKATGFSPAIGAPMPYRFQPLTDAEVDLLRQWILEGARNN